MTDAKSTKRARKMKGNSIKEVIIRDLVVFRPNIAFTNKGNENVAKMIPKEKETICADEVGNLLTISEN